MSLVFRPSLTAPDASSALHKLFFAHYQEGLALEQSCAYVGEPSYPSVETEAQARRSMVAALQYIGLDLSVKAIGQYARVQQLARPQYETLVSNLMRSSCSPNVSVYGLKLIKQNLLAAFDREDGQLPTFPGSPFVAKSLTEKNNSLAVKEAEFEQTLHNFRALCSWGGEVSNYRLLAPLLNNPIIMATVIRNMSDVGLVWDGMSKQVERVKGRGVQVVCVGLICRRVDAKEFNKAFPRSAGSTNVSTDLQRLWCGHFREQQIVTGERQHPQVRQWMKNFEEIHERQMAGQMVALMTGVPDLMVGIKQYSELQTDLRAGIDERWDNWAKLALTGFSRDMLFEESLEVKVAPRRDRVDIRQNLFAVDFNVTMGELDKLIEVNDKLRLTLELKFTKSWLRWVRAQWAQVNATADSEAMVDFYLKVAEYIQPQIAEKQKYFPTRLIRGGLEYAVARELLEQILIYQGPFLEDMSTQMVSVPVRLRYGMFALSYMRYKAQLEARNIALDL
jgi:hypothetical protein